MILPREFFDSDNNSPLDDLTDISEISNLSEAINSGELDLSQFEDSEASSMPQNTILGAPPVVVKSVEESNNTSPEVSEPGPTKEDTQRLERVESMLIALEGQIQKLSDSIEPVDTNISQVGGDVMDELLKTPIDEKDNSTVKIVTPEMLPKATPTSPEQQIAMGEVEFNKERLTELIQQKEFLIQERNNILNPSNYFNTTEIQQPISTLENTTNTLNQVLDNQTVEGNSDVNNIFKNISNVSNTNNSPAGAPSILNTSIESLSEPVPLPTAMVTPDVQNSFDNINETEITNNTANDYISNINEDTVNNQNTAFATENANNQNFSNINNAFTDTTNINQEREIYESVLPPGNNTTNTLPTPENEVNVNAKNIVEILQGIKEGIIKLNDGLGTNFGNLNQSMQGLKASVVNNSYNNFAGNNSMNEQSMNTSNEIIPMPDYRGDYPQSSDFPPGFNLSKLGGTNLPNPPSII